MTIQQPIKRKLHIVSDKKSLKEAFVSCYQHGGFKETKGNSMEELATLIEEFISFDYNKQGVLTSLEHNSLVRELKEIKSRLNTQKSPMLKSPKGLNTPI